MAYYRRIKVWSVLLRLFHWAFALSIFTLLVTGYYIHNPFALGPWPGVPTNFIMAKVRFLHFVAGYVFIAALFVRLYLLLFGNRYERFWDFLPITPRNIRRLGHTIKAYLYLEPHQSHGGHNPLAGTVYLTVILLGIFLALSGLFLLYPESATWTYWGYLLFGSQQVARMFHYLLFWFFFIFVLLHLYLVIWNDIFGTEAIISSIFSGRKFLKKEKA
ncbi:MAG: Ni/Fe-hydrogenase, b-type cytochrome subunit [Thermodesulfobacteria bacterium]|nr:Ni/Fe-hydrogenase, b-type cytochrome subunit [Thermodesulfobacteriota bacterium]